MHTLEPICGFAKRKANVLTGDLRRRLVEDNLGELPLSNFRLPVECRVILDNWRKGKKKRKKVSFSLFDTWWYFDYLHRTRDIGFLICGQMIMMSERHLAFITYVNLHHRNLLFLFHFLRETISFFHRVNTTRKM